MSTLLAPARTFWFDKVTAPARIRLFVWLSLATQILIVVTGGLVRLTGSGLGCPTWPKCTDDSLVSTAEMGIHGVIEFGNRLLTFVLLIVAALTFITLFREHVAKSQLKPIIISFFAFVLLFVGALALAVRAIDALSISALGATGLGIVLTAVLFVWRAKQAERIGTLVPAFGLGFGIILQAVVGGITVLTELNSWIVGLHFVISSYLIALASVLVYRALPKSFGPVSPMATKLSIPVAVVGAITILVGVVVTGAGPHAGDANTPRNGLDLEVWQHFHSYPGYLMAALIALQLVFQLRTQAGLWRPLTNRAVFLLLVATLLQAVVGVVQARLGVPPFLVALHMFGAAVLSSMLTFQYLATRQRS